MLENVWDISRPGNLIWDGPTHFFPTTLCGVLVFDSVSRASSSSSARLLRSHFVTHHLWHNFVQHHLCHTPTFTPNFVTHQLSTQLCHTPSLTHNFDQHHLWHTTLSHTIFPTQLCHTNFHTQLCHTLSSPTWHNVISTFVSRGRRGVMSHPPSFCVAGVALLALGGALGLV